MPYTTELATTAHIPNEITVIIVRRTPNLALGNHCGNTRQQKRNSAVTNIPGGTAYNASLASDSSAEDHQNPMDAGTIVVGMEPSKPPTRPP